MIMKYEINFILTNKKQCQLKTILNMKTLIK